LTLLCRHLHLELCQLTRELNAIFEIPITILTTAYVTYVIRTFRYIFIHITVDNDFELIDFLSFNVWMLLYSTRLFCLNYVCESVSAKVNPHIILNIHIPRLEVWNIFVFLPFIKN